MQSSAHPTARRPCIGTARASSRTSWRNAATSTCCVDSTWRYGPEIANVLTFDVPVIDHASLLVKGPGAPGTAMHQDRPYWIGREATPSIISVWIALEDMSRERGGLALSLDNQVGVSEMSSFNEGSVLPHEERADPAGGFPILIRDDIASRLAASMGFVSLARGEAVAFDSFEAAHVGRQHHADPAACHEDCLCRGRRENPVSDANGGVGVAS